MELWKEKTKNVSLALREARLREPWTLCTTVETPLRTLLSFRREKSPEQKPRSQGISRRFASLDMTACSQAISRLYTVYYGLASP